MISVNVLVDHNKWRKSLNKPQLFFDKIIKRFPKKYSYFNKNVNFTLLLSNNTNIKKLNYKFRKKNNHTDVLSFPSFIKTDLKKELKKKGNLSWRYNYQLSVYFSKKKKSYFRNDFYPWISASFRF